MLAFEANQRISYVSRTNGKSYPGVIVDRYPVGGGCIVRLDGTGLVKRVGPSDMHRVTALPGAPGMVVAGYSSRVGRAIAAVAGCTSVMGRRTSAAQDLTPTASPAGTGAAAVAGFDGTQPKNAAEPLLAAKRSSAAQPAPATSDGPAAAAAAAAAASAPPPVASPSPATTAAPAESSQDTASPAGAAKPVSIREVHGRAGRTATESQVRLVKEVDGFVVDDSGSLALGHLLEWMDAASCLSAERHCGRSAVTLLMDDVDFSAAQGHLPKRGDMCIIEGKLTAAFGSSMEVVVAVSIAEVASNRVRPLCNAYFMYVVLKTPQDKGKVVVPQLMPQSALEHLEYNLAHTRKKFRTQHDSRLKQATPEAPKETTTPVWQRKNSIVSSENARIPIGAVSFTELVLPTHANHMGNTFGGQIMAWMAKGAKAAVLLHMSRCFFRAEAPPSTSGGAHDIKLEPLAIDRIHFKNPSHVGDRVQLTATITRVFEGPVAEVQVTVTSAGVGAQDAPTDVNEGYFVFAIRTTHDIVHAIKDVWPETVEQEEQYRRAVARQQWRHHRHERAPKGPMLEDGSGGQAVGIELRLTPDDKSDDSQADELAVLCISAVLCLNESTEYNWQRLPFVDDGATEVMIDRELDTPGAQTRFKLISTVKRPPRRVYDMLLDHGRRSEWDACVRDCLAQRKVGSEGCAELVHMVLAGSKIDAEVFVLRTWREHAETNSFVIASRSVWVQDAPPPENRLRGEVLPTGYILTETPGSAGESTDVIFIAQFDRTVFQTIRPMLLDSFKKLRTLLESEAS
eukprot:TRINITY_DN5905_c0_g4_i1.p1 TRINITY_DN5905_c0_g4~~TRINITY_DN5905_c0_g4_i1.p1  ORF type:complete len:795 (-),score=135.82 TRINITY_DN5905_c0_g4_i1:148-2532(-)